MRDVTIITGESDAEVVSYATAALRRHRSRHLVKSQLHDRSIRSNSSIIKQAARYRRPLACGVVVAVPSLDVQISFQPNY